jgi:signal transduction histidine kinase/CheY-like chemotaxis protein
MQISPLTCQFLDLAQDTREISLAEWKDRIHPDDRLQAGGELEKSVTGLCDYESEYRVIRADGTVRWIFAGGQPCLGEEDRPLRVVGIARDITQRRLAEQADHHRQKLESLGILAGGIAHDFNNLLTGILGNASLLLDTAFEGSFEHDRLRDLVNAGERAAQLTQQMLAYSGRGHFITRPLSIGDEAREIAALLRASIPRHVRVQFETDRGAPQVDGDKSQIQQLLMNLVINAAEAIGSESGTVRISTRHQRFDRTTVGFYPAEKLPPGDYLVLEIQDDGHGMTEATKAQIFDPFFTTKFTGRGLGLAAVLGIVRGHRGGISVESAPGIGTTFRICLPASGTAAAASTGKEHAPDALSGQGTILVVDDEAMVRNVAKNSLERYGYRVLLAEDGREAVEIFTGDPRAVSLVLLDMAMPGMDGAETLKRLRAVRAEVSVIASSGYSEMEAAEKFGEGLAGFLQKPYAAKQLAAKVLSVLRPAVTASLG